MAQMHMTHESHLASFNDVPDIRKISIGDVRAAIRAGYEDFKQQPSHAVFLAMLYPILCIVLIVTVAGYELHPLVYPLIAGFSLLGPLAALGLYEMSRRAESGEPIHWRQAFGVFRSAALRPILMLGFLLLVLFAVWLLAAYVLYGQTLGQINPAGIHFDGLFTTNEGWIMIIVGNGIGLIFATLVFIISAVSFPLMLDRHVEVSTAMATSMRAVLTNPWPMTFWAGCIALGLVAGFIPFAIGLAIVLPILGHSTWHLYRALVA